MQNLLGVWNGLDMRRRIVVVLATLAVFVSVLLMSRMASSPQMSLLFAGLDGAAAGEVVTALEARGENYEVRGNGIYVPAANRDALRMSLAAEGMPATGGAGYELLDNLSGFGTTSQMFDAAYWRAKEGELARTIVAAPFARAARVHLSAGTTGSPFRQGPEPAASVFITPAGEGLSLDQSRALAFLVSSAVSGLDAARVTVIDARTGRVLASDETVTPSDAGQDLAEVLKLRVERLLSAHVGPGRAVVEVSVDTETAREEIVERLVDPDSRVAISTDSESRTSQSSGDGGAVTVASNLPDGDAAAGEGQSSQNNETRERVNFEVSETQRQVLRAPGDVTRITLAVLVDGVVEAAPDGTESWRARDEDELAALRDLVASAVGFDAERGDVITLKSLPLQPLVTTGTSVEQSFMSGITMDLTHLLQVAVLAIVALCIALFVVRPILMRPAQPDTMALASDEMSMDARNAPANATEEEAFDQMDMPEIDLDQLGGGAMDDFDFSGGGDAGLPDLSVFGGSDEDPVSRLRGLIEDRREETLEVLRGWMDDEKEKAG